MVEHPLIQFENNYYHLLDYVICLKKEKKQKRMKGKREKGKTMLKKIEENTRPRSNSTNMNFSTVELQNVISSSLQLFTKSDFLKEFQSQQVNYKKLYKLHSDTIIFGAINFVVTLHVSGTFRKKVADYLGSYVNDRSCLRFVVARVPRRKSQ